MCSEAMTDRGRESESVCRVEAPRCCEERCSKMDKVEKAQTGTRLSVSRERETTVFYCLVGRAENGSRGIINEGGDVQHHHLQLTDEGCTSLLVDSVRGRAFHFYSSLLHAKLWRYVDRLPLAIDPLLETGGDDDDDDETINVLHERW